VVISAAIVACGVWVVAACSSDSSSTNTAGDGGDAGIGAVDASADVVTDTSAPDSAACVDVSGLYSVARSCPAPFVAVDFSCNVQKDCSFSAYLHPPERRARASPRFRTP
jgi:hypothetical protein